MKMYRNAFLCVVVSTIVLNSFSIPSSFAANKTQLFKPSKAGRISTVVANTILNGVTPPKSSDGIDGDFYIDTKTMFFYGPKSKSHWPSPTSLRGPQGQSGANGSNGTDAKPIANIVAAGAQGLTGATGPKGEQGAQGVAGPAGPKGETGPAGSVGASGLPGATGSPGSSGGQGAQGPQGPQGSAGGQGAQGPQGAPGAQGAQGASGAVGPTGATGPAGSSNVYVISIPTWSLSTGTGGVGADSAQFGTLSANKSYRFSIIVHGVTNVPDSYFGVSVKAGPISVPTLYESAVYENFAYVGTSFVHRYSFIVNGTVVVGDSDSWLKVNVVDGGGATSGASAMGLSGQAIVQLVGQVTQTS